MKKKFITLIAVGVIFVVYVIMNTPLQGLASWCESKGGRWSEESNLCSSRIDGFSCTISGGKYYDCDDRMVDENGTVRSTSNIPMCIQTCQFN